MRAGGGDQQAEQHGDGGGLAGTVAAEQADGRAGSHGEADVVDRQRFAVAFSQVVHPDGVHAMGIRAVGRLRQGGGKGGVSCRTLPTEPALIGEVTIGFCNRFSEVKSLGASGSLARGAPLAQIDLTQIFAAAG